MTCSIHINCTPSRNVSAGRAESLFSIRPISASSRARGAGAFAASASAKSA